MKRLLTLVLLAVLAVPALTGCNLPVGHGPAPECPGNTYAQWENDANHGHGGWICPGGNQ